MKPKPTRRISHSSSSSSSLPILLSSLLLLLLLLLSTSTPSAADNITLNSALYASTPTLTWTSPNKDFSLGFTAAGASHYASVRIVNHNNIPVWTAGGAVDATASLRLLPDGNLRLSNGSSGAVVWQSNTTGLGVSSASLLDSGNLVLLNGTGTVWSSFDNPTDTILPSQIFTTSSILRSGLYSFSLLPSGNLTLKWKNSIVYWNSGQNSSITTNLSSSPSLEFQSIGILSLRDRTLSSAVVMAYSSDYAEGNNNVFRFLRLDGDGNLRIYSYAQGSENGTERWSAVADQCLVFGYCGNFGICSYNDTGPICECPSLNFEPIDPTDSRKGCKRKVEIADCPGNAAMLELDHAKFLTYPPELASQVISSAISACGSNCLVSNPCIASTSLSDGSGFCYQKYPDFVSGYKSPALPSTSFLKVCGPIVGNPSPSVGVTEGKFSRFRIWIVVVAVIGSLLGLVMFEGGLWWWCCRNKPEFGGSSAHYALIEYASGAPVQFSYKELQRATKGFRDKLGAGGFGAVYRGVVANKIVAVKQLEGIDQGEKQFRMEVATISSTHHLNLVRLIGFCSEGRHRLLVYEFMKNGSVDRFLFMTDEESGKSFSWERRFRIALGTAKGITYLHEECRDCIVHCDIKPENILLDEDYNARVSDFGLAKLVNPKDHRGRTLSSVRGTRGYLAPEWIANLPITSKSDLFSYGMVLLELVSGRRNFEVSAQTNLKKFSIWAYEEFEKGNVRGIVDKRLLDYELDMEQVIRAIQVSFWCIQEQPTQRPMMGKVVQMLEGIIEIEKPPPPKATAEGSLHGTSVNRSTSVSAFSTFAASAPVPPWSSSLRTPEISKTSSSSSFRTAEISSFVSRRNGERSTSGSFTT